MASRDYFELTETDDGTKQGAIDDSKTYQKKLNKKFMQAMDAWWENVKMTAIALCPVDTGTLAATIRIVVETTSGESYEVVAGPEGHPEIVQMIVAGGLLVNPKTGRICDYAQVVHDGYAEEGRLPNPFLTEAIALNMGELESILSNLLNEAER